MDEYCKTSIISARKTIIALILYTLSKKLMRVSNLGRISKTDTIVSRFNLNRLFIFQSVGLYSMVNLTAIFVQVCTSSSIIALLNYFDTNIFEIITTSSNSTINTNSFILLIIFAALLLFFRIALYQLTTFIYL